MGERALELAPLFKSDQYLFFKSWGGLGHNNLFKGEGKGNFEIGERLLEYGKRHSNIRCLVVAHICQGYAHFARGNFPSAINCFKKAIGISADPFYTEWPKLFLSISYLLNGQADEDEEVAWETDSYIQNFGCEVFGIFVYPTLAIASITKGRMAEGMRMLHDAQRTALEKDDKYVTAFIEYLLGKVYLQIVEGAGPIKISIIVRNIGFLLKSIPFASKKAENHFKNAIEAAEGIGANGILGLAFFDLGLLHKAKKRIERAKECVSQAIRVFEQCEAEVYLKQAKGALASLG